MLFPVLNLALEGFALKPLPLPEGEIGVLDGKFGKWRSPSQAVGFL